MKDIGNVINLKYNAYHQKYPPLPLCKLKALKLCSELFHKNKLCFCSGALSLHTCEPFSNESTPQLCSQGLKYIAVSNFGFWSICDQWLKGVADPGSLCSTKMTKCFVVPVWSSSPEIKTIFSIQHAD